MERMEDTSNNLIWFNGHTGSGIEYHKEISTGVQAERQVLLDNAPFRQTMSNLALSYTVGQRFWSNFPTHYDMEYGGGDPLIPCVMTVVSMEYIDDEELLPDV